MRDAHDIEQAMHAIWLSLHEAAAVAGCIPMVMGADAAGSVERDERVLALAGAVERLIGRARERVEAAEADLKRPPAPAGAMTVAIAAVMAA